MAAVATGVGFSIMLSSLMQGSQDDFMRQLIDAVPHIAISDEQREPARQPAELAYGAAEIHGLVPQARRPGIKNPLAIVAGLEAWVPGSLTPSVPTKVILRYAGRDVAASVIGIDPRREVKVSQLATQMRLGTLDSLYRASNAIILGDRLAEKFGARPGANITIQTSVGGGMTAQVVGTFHAGIRQIDESTGYVLLKTAQILSAQTGLVNEIRVRVAEPMKAQEIAAQIERDTKYKSVSWQEAHEELISSFVVRDIMVYAVVGAILLVASFGTYNIISTITHEKARDIAILKSLGLREETVRVIFVLESQLIGLLGVIFGSLLGYALCIGFGSIEIRSPFMDVNHLPFSYLPWPYLLAGGVAMVSSLAAGYLPARKAARVHPVEIIRGAT